MSIHQDCSNCDDISNNEPHVFLPVYLDSSGVVLDNSQNYTNKLDSSYNFIMEATLTQANYLRSAISYKNNNENYTFKYDLINKTLLVDSLKYDLENTKITIHNSTFNSGHSPSETNLANAYIQYIADTLIGHPFSQAFISNESAIIHKLNSSNIQTQFINALINNLNTSSFNINTICKSIVTQMKNNMPSRFLNEEVDTEYNLPFCPGDYISLFIKMKCNIELDNTLGQKLSDNSQYDMLKSMFADNIHVEFDDNDKTMKLIEKVWRIKIKLA
uniref:Uncharacterized protein n=1 Tax=viral metagenome TaxID=1070528 RepID=A0A6C0LZT9_9ZZZZ